MTEYVQFLPLDFDHVPEPMFLAGYAIDAAGRTDRAFRITGASYTVDFSGKNLDYDGAGGLSEGTVYGFTLRDISGDAPVVVFRAGASLSSTGMMEAAEFNAAMTRHQSDPEGAVATLLADWLNDFYWAVNHTGGLLQGYDGPQTLYGSAKDDVIRGGAGDDNIQSNGGADRLYGGSGNDYFHIDWGDSTIWGGSGSNNYLVYDRARATVYGGAESDYGTFGKGADIFYGRGGDDVANMGAGSDGAWGGKGSDRLSAGNGDDEVRGGAGDDVLKGDGGSDSLYGGAGNDDLDGGIHNDHLDGGGGDDFLNGGSWDDVLIGGSGDDILTGGSGVDHLWGGPGNDQMRGGADADTFIFVAGDGSARILDFQLGEDTVELDADLVDGIPGDDPEAGLAAVAEVVNNGLTLTFASGEVLRFTGITDVTALAGDVTLV
ncbi:MAG: hypothetical protein KDK24_06730 [Pseudooceanicola sp.]|nr:hypothetical protein [Pseudooceanicola sp.]